MKECNLVKVLKQHSIVGVIGNRSTAKTSMVLTLLLELRAAYPHLTIATMGINVELWPLLRENDIVILNSTMDVLDLRIRDTIIFIDEFAMLFDPRSSSKQTAKLQKFCDRIEHQNCKLIVSTARESFYNKLLCGIISAFLVKQIEYASLVNGTWIKERVKAITSSSDYRLEVPNSDYYVVTGDSITTKHSFPYLKVLDTKKTNTPLFVKVKK